jgi:virginiamycin B lyase
MRRAMATLVATLTAVAAFALPSAANALFYWPDGYINRAALDGSGLDPDFIQVPDAGCIVVDKAYIYWEANGGVGRANLDGTDVNNSFIPTLAGVTGCFAFDAQHIYWGTWGGVGRANLDGSGANPNFITGANGPMCEVALDSGHVYWQGVSSNVAIIGRANLDGSGVNQNFIAPTGNGCGLAVDSSHIYWSTGYYGGSTIGRADIDGSHVNSSFITSADRPCGLVVDSSHIYWANGGHTPSFIRANLDGTGVTQLFELPLDHPAPCGFAMDSLILSQTTVTPSAATSVYGDPSLKFTATVTGGGSIPTGSVAFRVNGVQDGPPVSLDPSDQAVYDSSYYLNVGDAVSAHYTGDSVYGPSADTVHPEIQPAETQVSTALSSPSAVVDSPIEFTTTVKNLSTEITPFGSVTLSIDGYELGSAPLDGNGQVSGTLIADIPGDFTVTVSYHDDTGYPADFTDSAASFVVHVAPPLTGSPVAPPPPPQVTPPAQVVLGIRPAATTCTVPRLKSLKLPAAKRRLAQAHCKLGKVTRKRGKRAMRARVLTSKPGAGHRTSGRVALVVGK